MIHGCSRFVNVFLIKWNSHSSFSSIKEILLDCYYNQDMELKQTLIIKILNKADIDNENTQHLGH